MVTLTSVIEWRSNIACINFLNVKYCLFTHFTVSFQKASSGAQNVTHFHDMTQTGIKKQIYISPFIINYSFNPLPPSTG